MKRWRRCGDDGGQISRSRSAAAPHARDPPIDRDIVVCGQQHMTDGAVGLLCRRAGPFWRDHATPRGHGGRGQLEPHRHRFMLQTTRSIFNASTSHTRVLYLAAISNHYTSHKHTAATATARTNSSWWPGRRWSAGVDRSSSLLQPLLLELDDRTAAGKQNKDGLGCAGWCGVYSG